MGGLPGPVGRALWPHRGNRDVARAKEAEASCRLFFHGVNRATAVCVGTSCPPLCPWRTASQRE
jgi:hypothetical protein